MDDTLYFFVNKHIYTVDFYWWIFFFNTPLRRNGVDTSFTLDAAQWNCACGELSSCVINTIPLDHVLTKLRGIQTKLRGIQTKLEVSKPNYRYPNQII